MEFSELGPITTAEIPFDPYSVFDAQVRGDAVEGEKHGDVAQDDVKKVLKFPKLKRKSRERSLIEKLYVPFLLCE